MSPTWVPRPQVLKPPFAVFPGTLARNGTAGRVAGIPISCPVGDANVAGRSLRLWVPMPAKLSALWPLTCPDLQSLPPYSGISEYLLTSWFTKQITSSKQAGTGSTQELQTHSTCLRKRAIETAAPAMRPRQQHTHHSWNSMAHATGSGVAAPVHSLRFISTLDIIIFFNMLLAKWNLSFLPSQNNWLWLIHLLETPQNALCVLKKLSAWFNPHVFLWKF